MALVKQEVKDENQMDSDSWLSYWTNTQEKVKEEQEKLYKSDIKKGTKDVGSDESELHFDDKNDESDVGKKSKGNKTIDQKQFRMDNNFCSKSNNKRKSKSNDTKKQKSFIYMSSEKSDIFNNTVENAVVSENIESLCVYQCPICNAVYQSSTSLLRHARSSNCSNGSKISIYSCLKTTVVHQCSICSQKVLCDRNMIGKHIRSHKNLSLAKYSSMCNLQNNYKNINIKQKFDQFCLTYSGKIELSSNIGNLCLFLCKKCEFSSHRWKNMAKHLNACEKLKAKFTSPTYYVTKVTTYKCKICDELMLCDYVILQHHLKKHGILIGAYIKTKESFSCVQFAKENYMQKLKPLINDIPLVQVQPKCFLAPGSLPESKLTKHVGNICSFKCPVCTLADFRSYHAFTSHHRKVHHVKSFIHDIQNVVTEARYHKCLICAKIVFCDNLFVAQHLIYAHKIKLSEYNNNFVIKSGGIVVPTYQDYDRNSQVFDSLLQTRESEQEVFQAKHHRSYLILPSMISSESEDSDEGK